MTTECSQSLHSIVSRSDFYKTLRNPCTLLWSAVPSGTSCFCSCAQPESDRRSFSLPAPVRSLRKGGRRIHLFRSGMRSFSAVRESESVFHHQQDDALKADGESARRNVFSGEFAYHLVVTTAASARFRQTQGWQFQKWFRYNRTYRAPESDQKISNSDAFVARTLSMISRKVLRNLRLEEIPSFLPAICYAVPVCSPLIKQRHIFVYRFSSHNHSLPVSAFTHQDRSCPSCPE